MGVAEEAVAVVRRRRGVLAEGAAGDEGAALRGRVLLRTLGIAGLVMKRKTTSGQTDRCITLQPDMSAMDPSEEHDTGAATYDKASTVSKRGEHTLCGTAAMTTLAPATYGAAHKR